MKKIIIPVVFSLVMLCGGCYYLYKFNNYPMQKVVHCYLKENGNSIPWSEHIYTIENGKFVNRIDISRLNYTFKQDVLEFYRNKWGNGNKYKGFLDSFWQDEKDIIEIRYYNFRNLTDEEYTDIWYQDPDKEQYHVPLYIEDITKVDDDFIKRNREFGYICY